MRIGEIQRKPLASPTRIASNALSAYNTYYRFKSRKIKKIFLHYSNLLVKRFVSKGNLGLWPFYYTFPRATMFGCKVPWVSALTQGLGISALVSAYCLTNDKIYLSTAESALEAFSTPMAKGGILSIDDDGDWWFEEYADVNCKPSGVLNGFIFSLLGL